MAFRINSNIAALNALRHLHDTEDALSTILERLSSGRNLIHASDGPAAMVIREQMKSTCVQNIPRNSAIRSLPTHTCESVTFVSWTEF